MKRKLKIYGPKDIWPKKVKDIYIIYIYNRSRKAAEVLARRARSRHWSVTLVFL